MKYTFFEIENFRGIEKVRIDLQASPRVNIYTLVGLNESGKTTILDALNYFTFKTETLASLELPRYSVEDVHSLIPISKRSNFNGMISIKVGLELEPGDIEKLRGYVQSELGFKDCQHEGTCVFTQRIAFKNSTYDSKGSTNTWDLRIKIQEKGKGKRALRPTTTEEWSKIFTFLKGLFPAILYFPNFLFEFPDKIYLKDEGSEKDKFYRLVIQDILDSLNNNLKLNAHVLDRIKSGQANDKRSLEGLLLEMGRNVTDVIFGSWSKIFKQKFTDKRIGIIFGSDEESGPFLQFRLEDSDGFYQINERSLGFRWFFVFLLLTQYRGFRKNGPHNVLFLFDEPASNLHPSAQTLLLDSFKELTKNCKIIYTTHSHHLINPEWLEATFVVKNEGLDYHSDRSEYSAKKTKVSVYKYREFVSRYPDQTDYFRPILDILDYRPSAIEPAADVVFSEGKNDYYSLAFASIQTAALKHSWGIVPGMGSGSHDASIRLYIAWGRNFIILLDSDKEGKKQKRRYEEEFGWLIRGRIYELMDVDPSWDKKEMEDLYDPADRLLIQMTSFPQATEFDKKVFNRSLQELLAKKTLVSISSASSDNFLKLFNFVTEKLVSTKGLL